MCQPKEVHFSCACGQYWMDEQQSACSKAQTVERGWRTERVPCVAHLTELERSRKESRSLLCMVKGEELLVYTSSRGHCKRWQQSGSVMPMYSKPTAVSKPVDQDDTSGSDVNAKTGSKVSDKPERNKR